MGFNSGTRCAGHRALLWCSGLPRLTLLSVPGWDGRSAGVRCRINMGTAHPESHIHRSAARLAIERFLTYNVMRYSIES